MRERLKEGDRVCYTKRFLRSIGAPPTDQAWFWRGTLMGLVPFGPPTNASVLAEIMWDPKTVESGPLGPVLVNPANISRIDSREAYED